MTATHPYDDLIAQLSVEQKVRLLTGETAFTLWAEPEIGLGALAFSDGPTGVRGLKFTGGERVALFPNATVLASSWDAEVLREVGGLLAAEARRQDVNVVLGPTVNLHRSPLGGRLFEQYSEDPLLTGVLAAAYVQGLQASGVGACLKHLVANESETERRSVDSALSEAALREVYLLPFEIAIEDADPWTLMAAYNKVNGVPATEQGHVQNEVVKGEWGWEGLIMSDWSAATRTVETAVGGLDLVMPGPGGPWEGHLVSAVHEGRVPLEMLDDKVRRLLRLADRTGRLGEGSGPERGEVPAVDSAVRVEQLTRLASRGMTLLSNVGGVLPLRPEQRVALIGRPAVTTACMGGGSAHVNAPYEVSIADGLSTLHENLTVADGVEVRTRGVAARPGFVVDPTTGEPGLEITLLDADGVELETRHGAETAASLGWEDGTPRPVAAAVLRGRVETGGRLEVGVIGVGRWTVALGPVEGEQYLGVPGGDPGAALLTPPSWRAEGEVEPGTVLQARVDLAPDDEGATVPGIRGLIARPAPRPTAEVIAEAAEAAADADVAVVVVGLTEEQETEAADKETLRLPGQQDALVNAVVDAAKRTIVVVNAATPVLMPWAERVDAVLVIGLPGQEGGHAVAKVLLGELEPTGRLVTTWPVADGATPGWNVAPVEGRLEYREGTYVGYRGHFPFGHAPEPAAWLGEGLGYTTWAYSNAFVEEGPAAPVAHVTLRNTGKRDSREVVQVYYRPEEPDQPVRLAGFLNVAVAAGERVEVAVPCDPRVWQRWDEESGGWASLSGKGELLIARGLGDIRARLTLG